MENPFWEKSMWKERKRKRKKKNNAKFSGHYVRAHTLYSHQYDHDMTAR